MNGPQDTFWVGAAVGSVLTVVGLVIFGLLFGAIAHRFVGEPAEEYPSQITEGE